MEAGRRILYFRGGEGGPVTGVWAGDGRRRRWRRQRRLGTGWRRAGAAAFIGEVVGLWGLFGCSGFGLVAVSTVAVTSAGAAAIASHGGGVGGGRGQEGEDGW